jgi:hypothetical protein
MTLQCGGIMSIARPLSLDDTLNVAGDVVCDTTLTVTGASTLTGAVTCQSTVATFADVTATRSAPGGGNVTNTISNTGTGGFASLYLGAPAETGQVFVGQGTGLVIRTTTNHAIRLSPNNVESLTLRTDGSATFAGAVQRVQHHCLAYQAASYSVPSGTTVVLPLGASKGVRGTNPYNPGINRFVAPLAGLYKFTVKWQCFTTKEINTELRVNGTSEALTYRGSLTHVVYLTTSDYVQVFIRHVDTVACALYTDAQVTCVTCTML